jgi:hypothetical protein
MEIVVKLLGDRVNYVYVGGDECPSFVCIIRKYVRFKGYDLEFCSSSVNLVIGNFSLELPKLTEFYHRNHSLNRVYGLVDINFFAKLNILRFEVDKLIEKYSSEKELKLILE